MPQRDMRLHLGPTDTRWLAAFLATHGINRGQYLAVAPTAQWRSKCWPIDRYAALVRALLDRGDAGTHAVVLSSPRERPTVQPLLDAFASDGRVVAPITTVGQMMAITSACQLLVGNDSAPLHVAVGFQRRIVAIFGPTNPALVGPYGCDRWVVRPPAAVAEASTYRHQRDDQTIIAAVSIDAVLERAAAALREPRGGSSVGVSG
jgi:heptosyltransferase I